MFKGVNIEFTMSCDRKYFFADSFHLTDAQDDSINYVFLEIPHKLSIVPCVDLQVLTC